MTAARRSWSCAALALALFGGAARGDFQTEKFQALLSATETESDGNSELTVAWNLDAEWRRPGKKALLSITVDSDYSRSSRSKLDRLRTGFRLMDDDYGKKRGKWYPVFLLQTEGDHAGESIHTLAAAGYRQKIKYGFIEITLGASKDIRADEAWVGDIGTQIGYERQWGKWKVSTGPKGEFGTVGDVRLRG
ncbi:MAG: hypothetical protein ACE5O2_09530, partial [Armatimonadota bacterium]